MIVTDLDTLLSKEVQELPAQIQFQTADGTKEKWDLKLEVRGRFRRRECDVPPLKLNFVKSELKERGLYKYDDIKLVTHCLDAEEAKENIIKEWLVYQMYEHLTEASFRTQLINIVYKDDNSSLLISNIGILIESIEQVGKRMDLKECDGCMGLTAENYQTEALLRMAVFQYMIGNTDWSGHLARNMKTLGKKGETVNLLPIPYDFDFSALVAPSYAIPTKEEQTALGDRVYLGAPLEPQQCEAVLNQFSENRDRFFQLINSCEALSKNAKKDMIKYLESFYKELDKGKLSKTIAEAQPLETRY